MAVNTVYQGGGDISLTPFVGGVYNAFQQGQERDRAIARENQLKEEKSLEKFQAQYADAMAKVSTKGLRNQDIPGFQKLYSEIEDLYVKSENVADKSQRLLNLAKFKEATARATVYVQQSEALGKRESELMKSLQGNFEKYDADTALKALQDHFNKPMDQTNRDFDLLQYRNKYDEKQISKTLESVRKNLLESSPNATTSSALVGSVQNGYDRVNTFRTTRSVPREDAIQSLQSQYNTDQNFKRYVDTQFEGNLGNKLGQLYNSLGANWGTEVSDAQRTAGRAPVRSSSESDRSAPALVNTGIDLAFAGDNTVTANKQVALKGNGMKARITKDVTAYDMATGQPIDITTGMQDGTIMEFVNLPTANLGTKGRNERRILTKGTEGRLAGRQSSNEDFAVVRYKKPIYVTTEDRNTVYTGQGKDLQERIQKKQVVQSGSEEVIGLFPMRSVLPGETSMTKSEKATVQSYLNTPAPSKPQSSARKVLSALGR